MEAQKEKFLGDTEKAFSLWKGSSNGPWFTENTSNVNVDTDDTLAYKYSTKMLTSLFTVLTFYCLTSLTHSLAFYY